MRIDLPSHIGIASAWHRLYIFALIGQRLRLFTTNNPASIDIEAEKIDRCRDDCHIAILNRRGIDSQIFKELVRILSVEKRLQKPASSEIVSHRNIAKRLRTIICGISG